MKLSELIIPAAIVPQLQHSDRDGAIEELINALIASRAVTKSLRGDLIKLIIDREKKGSTGFGKGVAVPHVKHAKIKGFLFYQ